MSNLLAKLSYHLLFELSSYPVLIMEFLASYVRMIWFFIILKHDDTYTTELHFLCEQIEVDDIYQRLHLIKSSLTALLVKG